MQDREIIRQRIRAKRKTISDTERMTSMLMATRYLAASELFNTAQNIACYLSTKNEFNTLSMIELIWQQKKKCFLPIVLPDKTLSFYAYDRDQSLTKNCFGILEPNAEENTAIDLKKLDLVLMPLTAFDKQGHRIGSGSGCYDKTFTFVKSQAKKPFLCGVAYSLQEMDVITPEAWDVNLKAILTENGLHYFD